MSDPVEPNFLPDWPRANTSLTGNEDFTCRIRASAEDFQVDEHLGFAPAGSGEHLLLRIRKRNRNTEQVARQVARHAGVRSRDVGYCGLKDRNAVTTQWFSIWLPGKADPDFSSIEDDDLQVIDKVRHGRKLQRGALKENTFKIIIRDVTGDQQVVEKRLKKIKEQGVPNYFGEQRFGHNGGNLAKAEAMFSGNKVKDRHVRGLYLSSARSFLFNAVLAKRILENNWNTILPGEAVMLSGSRSYFVCEDIDNEIMERCGRGDVHPSGPLWGKGELSSIADAEMLEREVLSDHSLFREGLEKAGMKQERRALRLTVKDLTWSWLDKNDLQLNFSLPAGSYATSVLREICRYQ
ncbi:tRNA pseudouridine(13) synthase TruD [Kaarinaea lacus]